MVNMRRFEAPSRAATTGVCTRMPVPRTTGTGCPLAPDALAADVTRCRLVSYATLLHLARVHDINFITWARLLLSLLHRAKSLNYWYFDLSALKTCLTRVGCETLPV
jgi:hypothetical protein